LWVVEAVLHVGGFVHRHNCHYWSEKDPGMTNEKIQSQSKSWCGVVWIYLDQVYCSVSVT
jgi:hypothetical protein